MPKQRTGLSSLNPTQSTKSIPLNIFPARVTMTILDNTTEREAFQNFGEWSSIGSLFFSKLNSPNPSKKFTTDNFAKPLFPNTSNIPLHNELVYVMALPNSNVQSDVNDLTYYYFQAINIWNSTHHNAIPDPINNSSLPSSQTQDYEQTSAGSVRRVTDGGTEIELGNTFQEKISIRNLQPYAGDIIHQGRWGQSLRFGSTVKETPIPNTWSTSGEDGDPITILRNGQYEGDTEPWIPQVEDINDDASSMWLTKNQKIPINVSTRTYRSYQTPPESPNLFTGEQILLNSGRLIFNSKTDSILLSAKKTINLNSVDSVNIDSPLTVIQSPTVLLGDKNATEPIILGDTFLSDFSSLMSSLVTLCQQLQVPMALASLQPHAGLPTPATQTLTKAQNMINRINNYKSKVSKSK
jgi:hypothetical protein|tara:strand:- start:2653 stop:3882 length:1230 start_codon:yes stop_codon:yes gene_type:complete